MLDSDGRILGIPEEPVPGDVVIFERRIRYAAKNVSLLEAVQAIAKQAGRMVSVEPYVLVNKVKPEEQLMITKSFLVPLEFAAPKPPLQQMPHFLRDRSAAEENRAEK